jgi:hypothetical protein
MGPDGHGRNVNAMRAVLLSLFLLALAPSAHASSWTPPKTFAAIGGEDAVPRAAISAAGSSTVAWRRADGRLVMTVGNASGRFRAPKVIANKPLAYAVAPGAVAYEARDGIHVYTRGRDRRVATSTGSDINGVAIAADPLGGYVIAERAFRPRAYTVRALSVDADGRRGGAVQELGAGQFGIDARPTQALAVLPDGRALLVFQRESASFQEPEPVVFTTRPHGGTFGEPVVVGDGLTDPRVTVSGDRAALTVARTAQCGDAGCAGAPQTIPVNADGSLGTPTGPTLSKPGRAFAAWSTPSALVFLLKTGPKPFSKEAPVRAWAGGALQTLTNAPSNEPVALALSGDRTLALWATRTNFGAALAGPDGTFRKTSAPAGAGPALYHFNATNRDARSAGNWAIVTWSHGRTIRVSIRHF